MHLCQILSAQYKMLPLTPCNLHQEAPWWHSDSLRLLTCMSILNAKQLKNQSSAAAAGIKGMPAQSQPQVVDFTAQAESPDIFDATLAAGAEPSEPSSETLDVEEEAHKNKKQNIQEVSKVKGMANKLYISQLSCSEHKFICICNAANASNEKKTALPLMKTVPDAGNKQ